MAAKYIKGCESISEKPKEVKLGHQVNRDALLHPNRPLKALKPRRASRSAHLEWENCNNLILDHVTKSFYFSSFPALA